MDLTTRMFATAREIDRRARKAQLEIAVRRAELVPDSDESAIEDLEEA